MKFILSTITGKMELQDGLYIGKKASEGSWLDKLNAFSDWVVHGEVELILKPIGAFFKEIGITLWDWFILNLPDIMGYSAVLAGVCIIFSSMFNKGGILKPIAVFGAGMILALCILGSV
ncbi:hypothetical protein CN326_20740 [Bacillus sp. AFS018417]|uniref:hypothetical protein n=1 Tax=Bacillus sp. AFS018417 TaxID=2033491 RepID=UPI000BF928BD|nr:hypothetical protein [Bacillus sp. AFS018417]PEZ01828.1 hypothetical protein CN326_20740 [Bacillus sp. AFS018417]